MRARGLRPSILPDYRPRPTRRLPRTAAAAHRTVGIQPNHRAASGRPSRGQAALRAKTRLLATPYRWPVRHGPAPLSPSSVFDALFGLTRLLRTHPPPVVGHAGVLRKHPPPTETRFYPPKKYPPPAGTRFHRASSQPSSAARAVQARVRSQLVRVRPSMAM